MRVVATKRRPAALSSCMVVAGTGSANLTFAFPINHMHGSRQAVVQDSACRPTMYNHTKNNEEMQWFLLTGTYLVPGCQTVLCTRYL